MSLIKSSTWPRVGGLLSDFFDDDPMLHSPWLRGQSLPAVNIKETENKYEIELAAPGYDKTDFVVSVDNGFLTIAAIRKEETEKKNDRYTRREFSCASFSRSFNLPENINEENIQASYEAGVLKLTIMKKDQTQAKPKRAIQIK